MVLRALRYLYRRLGPRYPGLLLAAQFQLTLIVVLGGTGLLTIYQPMSHGDFLRLLLVAEALTVVENTVSIVAVMRTLHPVKRWLAGQREPEATVAAWRTLVDLPAGHIRSRWALTPLFTLLPWSIYATAQLGLRPSGVVILFVGGMVVLAYGVILRFFGMEIVLRPVLEDVAAALPDGAPLPRAGIPTRWKLLAGLPLINIVTGVTVAGLSTRGQAHLSDLGFDVIVAVLVAFTLSLELTLLMSRSILSPIDDLREATRRVGRGDFSVRVPVLSTDEIGGLAQSFNLAIAGLEEREKLREAFGTYVDPEVAEKVLREGEVLEGDEVDVSILFLDIRDFTAFAERSSAHDVVVRLNEFWDLVVPAVTDHGGHANKFIGDGLLAVFGAPVLHEDHADRAVHAGIDIVRMIERRYGDALRVGVGVNSGQVVAGTIGGGGRLEFTVIGDAVNTAARVEQVTRQTGDAMLITQATLALLTRDHGGFDERTGVTLKGKADEVRLFAPRTLVDLARPPATPDVAVRPA